MAPSSRSSRSKRISPFCVKDRQAKVAFLNSAMARFLGKSPKQVIDKCGLALVADRDQADQIRANYLHLMETGITEYFEESGTLVTGPCT